MIRVANLLITLTVSLLMLMSCSASSDPDSGAKKLRLTAVTDENFVVAETDKYFIEHLKNYPVNTIRHARTMSAMDNQFVIRENQDVLYSHAVVDISKGAKIINPAWDVYSVIQVIDENHYTIAVIYPGETLSLTPEMVSLGEHVFLNMRTGLRDLDQAGLAEAHQHQDQISITANSAKPYQTKGFDKESLDSVRTKLEARKTEITKPWLMFGQAEDIDPTSFLIASAGGWGGLPAQHASYIVTIQPSKALSLSAQCSTMTLPVPPLQFDRGGFFSVSAYDEAGWIGSQPFALNNRQINSNNDGSYTFRFNCPGQVNNIDVTQNWSIIIRLYMPKNIEAILAYTKHVNRNINILPLR